MQTTLIIDFVMAIAAIAGGTGTKDFIYDFKLDQFGLFRDPNEDFVSYAKVTNTSVYFSFL